MTKSEKYATFLIIFKKVFGTDYTYTALNEHELYRVIYLPQQKGFTGLNYDFKWILNTVQSSALYDDIEDFSLNYTDYLTAQSVELTDDDCQHMHDIKALLDTPIQLRLYKQLPNIKYMIHSYCYIKTAVSTKHNFPCGAIEEVDEILKTINEHYGTRNTEFYEINLIGHGSIVMSSNLESLQDIEYYKRPMPEHIPE